MQFGKQKLYSDQFSQEIGRASGFGCPKQGANPVGRNQAGNKSAAGLLLQLAVVARLQEKSRDPDDDDEC